MGRLNYLRRNFDAAIDLLVVPRIAFNTGEIPPGNVYHEATLQGRTLFMKRMEQALLLLVRRHRMNPCGPTRPL